MASGSIYDAAHKGDFEYVSQKIEEDPLIIKAPDSSKRLLIHWAVLSGNVKLVTHLLELGSSVNPSDDTDMTPLILASSAGHTEVVKLLLKKCDDVNHKNAQGHSSLQYAASKGWTEICALLLEKGADVNIKDERGSTPLHRAASKGLLSVLGLLLSSSDIKVNVKDIYGNTPLHYACEEDRKEAAVMLVDHRADVEIKNREDKSCLDLCTPVLARLLKSNAKC
ncbi:26S proteasome non-ATPase regulatory subunit 10 [Diabrotica virgifera virgifera]|uniref:26S proteasome non-ATPase regulatory subunit 10-like n=1 Tax=Diabrotica virgifera virgifera TaxID=50390 RepID=A0A6P7FL57_DIAVI|nr:26S proteasome non-ATPase regulatory subunit 10 [Diabrotica virgifera virgifera]